MIRYIEHSRIDKQQWDNCITASSAGNVYACSWYLDIVSPGWNALVENDYHSVMPLTKRKRFGIEALLQPQLCQQLGVYSKENTSAEKIADFIQAIPSQFRLIDINLNPGNFISKEGYRTIKNLNHELRLDIPYKTISDAYSQNIKRNIRKALKNKIEIKNEGDPEDIIRLFKEGRGKSLSLKNSYFRLLVKLYTEAENRGYGLIKSAYDQNKNLIAGAIFIVSDKRAVFLFSGSSIEGKSTCAMSLLIDRFIYEYSGQEKILDFEGSNDKNLARFYKGFGSKECIYLQLQKNNLPWPVKKGLSLVRK